MYKLCLQKYDPHAIKIGILTLESIKGLLYTYAKKKLKL
jgi:hypothetical protein